MFLFEETGNDAFFGFFGGQPEGLQLEKLFTSDFSDGGFVDKLCIQMSRFQCGLCIDAAMFG